MLCGRKLKIVFETSLSAHNTNFKIYVDMQLEYSQWLLCSRKQVSIMGIKDF